MAGDPASLPRSCPRALALASSAAGRARSTPRAATASGRPVLQDRAPRAGRRRARAPAGSARRGRPPRALPGHPRRSPACRLAADAGLVGPVTRRLDGRPLSQLDLGWGRLLWLTLRLALLVVRLAWRGVSHDDLRPENILVDPAGRLQLIDFDQASSGPPLVCLARSLLGLRLRRPAGQQHPSGAACASACRRACRRRVAPSPRAPPPAGPTGLPALPPTPAPTLARARRGLAPRARAAANSPGAAIAYHELDCQRHDAAGRAALGRALAEPARDHRLPRQPRARARLQPGPALDLPAQGRGRARRRSRSTATP